MHENPPPTEPQQDSHTGTTPIPDAEFTRHKEAIAAQTTMTVADILKPATDTLSHW